MLTSFRSPTYNDAETKEVDASHDELNTRLVADKMAESPEEDVSQSIAGKTNQAINKRSADELVNERYPPITKQPRVSVEIVMTLGLEISRKEATCIATYIMQSISPTTALLSYT